jgi:hypothetical protein
MANAMYNPAREAFLGGDLDWDANTIKMYLIDVADYVFSAAHDFADDVPTAAKVATSGALANKTKTSGVADADDVVLTAVAGDVSEAMVLWQDSGVQATSRVIVYLDTATGLPVTPNGGDITIQWDSGANKIFTL